MPFSRMAPAPPPPAPGSPEAKLKTKLKRYHRKEKQSTPPKKKPKKAILPNGWYLHFHKVPRVSLKKLDEAEKRKGRKKLRGAWKKEYARCIRMHHVMRPWGEAMACKRGPDYPGIITPKVIARFIGLEPRYARRYLTQLKKSMGKEKDHLVTVDEFIKKKGIPLESIKPYLR